MSKKKNSKASKAKKAHVLAIAAELDTKGNAKNSAIESVKDLVVGVVGGGLAGAAIGKPSLLVGFGTSLIGHYMGSSMATSFGGYDGIGRLSDRTRRGEWYKPIKFGRCERTYESVWTKHQTTPVSGQDHQAKRNGDKI